MIVPLLVLLASAAGPGPATRPGKAAARAADAVRKADRDRCAAMAARDLDRFLALLADDVSFFPDRAPRVQGKAAAREWWAPFFDPKGPTFRCEPLTAEAAASGDVAYTTGHYVMKGTDAEQGPTRGHGKYVTVWRRRGGGGWKVAADIGNGEPPPERDFGPPPPP